MTIALRPDPTLLKRLQAEAKKRGLVLPVAPTPPRAVDWKPQAGPQEAAYNSDADVIGYGGAAGGGKSDLALGMAATKHTRSIIFRREFPRLEALIARSREIYNSGADRQHDRFNESLHRWELSGGRSVRFAAMQYEQDKQGYQGRPHDLYVFDEATEFTESQVRFVTAWNRTTVPGQRCRVLMPFNPPMDEAGEWVVRYFAPWLDPQHPHPAQDGELRWYAMVNGQETERPNGDPFTHDGGTIAPKSRTFFHASLRDNPILFETGYQAQIDALPEPLRSQLRGSFDAGRVANPFQVIPAEWVKSAQARWQPEYTGPMGYMGVDVARGGGDKTMLAPLRGVHFDRLLAYPGASTPNSGMAAGLITNAAERTALICIDVIGIGAAVYDRLQEAGASVNGVNFAERTTATDKSGRLSFLNTRAGAYWAMREALDPENETGIELPPDQELLSDLCAANWKLSAGKIQIEAKADIMKRIGRSPDRADAVVYAWWGKSNSGPLFYE